ncbi:glycosyltransferase 87 family protein [Streptomyces sp. NPDC054884]|uniref:glycosyltransferase family 87 protein n=1 Tax=Streptomyces sp. ME08-AFT2 TaxID=3028683 RepID=UPI0029A344CC|nr:glycosyltransferase family 87 protein [Streptomyces sp. ME08-AFT2]MDX3310364.1 glycosyltransferase family 87 protein [Streptomyces sp. ME08-AFT2]
METTDSGRPLTGLLTTWGTTRLVLLLCVFKVLDFPGPDVTSDVWATYRDWYEVLCGGAFPADDVTWQYPPAAALAILSPALLPFLDYASAFFVLAFLADLVVLVLLLHTGLRPGRSLRGAWLWTAGAALLGPTLYSRYDVTVTAVAVGALVAGVRHPRAMGALTGFAALLKVWPVLLLAGAVRRRAWGAAAVTAVALSALFALAMPGAFAFLTFQRDRGTEVESVGALVLHVARQFGWRGEVRFRYGSLEFTGPYVDVVNDVALGFTALAFGWLLLWRLTARRLRPRTHPEAAFTAVLLFTVTSRVISPQYLVWLVGLAAVCLCFRDSRMTLPAVLVLAASPVTVLEFPVRFEDVVASTPVGVGLMMLRNGLLVAAALTAAVRLWRSTASLSALAPPAGQAARTGERAVSP